MLSAEIIHYEDHPHAHIEATITFKNVKCTIGEGKSEKKILNGISGQMLPGNITAIIGSSGAGKTTLLDILVGRKNTGLVSGDILVNGEPRTKAFKRLAGYVMQDDVFMGTITVREHLMFTAMLRLPPHITKIQKAEKVNDVLQELGISHIADSLIGTPFSRGISGGERKRLAIAAELIVDPSILILDEPTSGLDSFSASSLITTLSALAHSPRRRNIIMSIHQPRSDIYYKFDYLMVLSQGTAVYYGRARDALSRFTSLGYICPPTFNPADFIIDIVSTTQFTESFGKQASQQHQRQSDQISLRSLNGGSEMYSTKPIGDMDEYAASFWVQFSVLTQRTFLNIFRNPFVLKIQYGMTLFVSLLLGYLYWQMPFDLASGGMQDRMGSLFFMVTLLSFSTLTSIDLFFSERLLFLRERANGCYRTSAYFLAKAVSDIIPMRVIPPLILGCTSYFMMGLNPTSYHFMVFLATLVLVSMAASGMCFIISAVISSVSVGNLVAILLMFACLLFGGFLVNTNTMHAYIQWITNLSFFTYGYTVLMINEFEDINILINVAGYDPPTLVPGTLILTQVGMDPVHLPTNMVVLSIMTVAFLVIAYLCLRFYVKEKR